ncbi:MAG: hemolysin D [Gemmatales bacterium]|nr:MAG: hemolysin D [Gemmatales bacterium]
MDHLAPALGLDRRKHLKLRMRPDLVVTTQRYEGKTWYIVKDPISMRYWRYSEQEHFLIELLDGRTTLEEARREYERRFRPHRLSLEDIETFGYQLLKAGLAYYDSPEFGKRLFEQGKKCRRREILEKFTNILYIRIPILDPDKLLERMVPWLRWVFTRWFMALSVCLMLAALYVVASRFNQFRAMLPSADQFFSFKNLVYLWAALGLVKVIHEFGHGLTCKAFGGEVHEMGFLLLCFAPCLYCNVSDSWTLANKWKRILISFAGIYVELIIATLATFVWLHSSSIPFVHNLSLSLMIVCSISTILFNANPLMRFDGYYVLADLIEIPNLRQRSNQYLKRFVQEKCLGMELPPEAYMSRQRRFWFIVYAVVSYVYRWVITFAILWFLFNFLRPYKLGAVGGLLALAALASMVGWPLYHLIHGIRQRGRLPDMKWKPVMTSSSVVIALLLAFFFLPLPVSRIYETGLVQIEPDAIHPVYVPAEGILKRVDVRDGQQVPAGFVLAQFTNQELENQLEEARTRLEIKETEIRIYEKSLADVRDRQQRALIAEKIAIGKGDRDLLAAQVREYESLFDQLTLRSPCAGVVLGAPRRDQLGQRWKKDESKPFCSIGDPTKLRVLVPLSPADYRLLTEEFASVQRQGKPLPASVRVSGLGMTTFRGRVTELPSSEAKEVPLALTVEAGGPVAAKPSPDSEKRIPQSQQFLVSVAIDKPSHAVCPGTFAQVKIPCRWRSAAWWLWRKLCLLFDLGLF